MAVDGAQRTPGGSGRLSPFAKGAGQTKEQLADDILSAMHGIVDDCIGRPALNKWVVLVPVKAKLILGVGLLALNDIRISNAALWHQPVLWRFGPFGTPTCVVPCIPVLALRYWRSLCYVAIYSTVGSLRQPV